MADTVNLRVGGMPVFCPECKAMLEHVAADGERIVLKHGGERVYRSDCPHQSKLLAIPVQRIEATVI